VENIRLEAVVLRIVVDLAEQHEAASGEDLEEILLGREAPGCERLLKANKRVFEVR
jgi:hypothetical protein